MVPTVHSYETVSASSGSVTFAEQVRLSSLYTLLDGTMVRSVNMGSVFSTVITAVEVMVSPLESVAVAVQVMVSPTSVSEEETM